MKRLYHKVADEIENFGKKITFLQTEASACGLGLANVPNVHWHMLHCLSLHETQRWQYGQ